MGNSHQAGPPRPTGNSRPAGPSHPAGQDSSATHLGMPIRVPQANLAPQLRSGRDTGAQPAARETPGIDPRPPDATRNMMIMMQQGWQRGRVDNLDDPLGAPMTEPTDSEAGNGTD